MKTRLYFVSACLIGVCLAWLVPFYQILTQGCIYAGESNQAILLAEIGMFFVLIGFAVSNILKVLR